MATKINALHCIKKISFSLYLYVLLFAPLILENLQKKNLFIITEKKMPSLSLSNIYIKNEFIQRLIFFCYVLFIKESKRKKRALFKIEGGRLYMRAEVFYFVSCFFFLNLVTRQQNKFKKKKKHVVNQQVLLLSFCLNVFAFVL